MLIPPLCVQWAAAPRSACLLSWPWSARRHQRRHITSLVTSRIQHPFPFTVMLEASETLSSDHGKQPLNVQEDIDQERANKRVKTMAHAEESCENPQDENPKQHPKQKNTRNARHRSRRGTRPEADPDAKVERDVEKALRLPKKPCALLIGFCGSGFNGMQIQRNVRTIEGELFAAMVKAGAVSQDNADDPVKVKLARAARTDAGVHAAGNVVSLKMIISIPGTLDVVTRINEELPPEIRVWGYARVQKSFNARTFCDSRKYTYFFPTYLLIPPKPGSGLHSVLLQHRLPDQRLDASASTCPGYVSDAFWDDISGTAAEDLTRKRKWRITPDHLAAMKELAKKFEGTHNFHNFTVGREYRDPSNKRHMKEIKILEPAVCDETEWLSVSFHGQSFMLHQIRKMMAALLLSCRTGTPPNVIDELYGPQEVRIPKMPALGLLLEHPIFDSYNAKVSATSENLHADNDDYRPTIDFSLHRDEMERFKQKFIYDKMRNIEDQDGLFDSWVRSIDAYEGNDLLYLNPRGVIPADASIRQGEKREIPFHDKKRFDATSFQPDDQTKVVAAEEADDADGFVDG